MRGLLERLGDGEVLVADGAMGTMLFRMGLEPGGCPESVNLTDRRLLEEIAREYLDAGADIIQANTFGASPMKLSNYGLEGRAEEINREAVLAVRQVVGDRAYVSCSCGPSGSILKPYGDAEPDDILRGFERQMRALVDAGVDIICIETMIDLHEATLAVRAAKSVSPRTPVSATMTFDRIPRGFFTIMGVRVEDAARGLQEVGADIVGSNCGNGMENMIEIAREFRAFTDLPVIIQSNAGQPKTRDGMLFYHETPEFFAEKAVELLDEGVSIIGGCCGTTPEHIRAIRGVVDSRTVGR